MHLKRSKLDIINDIRKEIKEEYLNTGATPWIIGYSGGKDSTTVLQLVVEVLLDLQREEQAEKMVYVISSDTLVENPMVLGKTKLSIDNINQYARKKGLPLKAEMIYPRGNNTFFVNLIGRGYPSPVQSFRWCTDRIKIMPANDYIHSKVSENGEVILLLGTREAESTSRKRNMEKHYIKGSRLSMHSTLENAWTYSPIAKLSTKDVWGYLLKNHCPWGDNNNDLYRMYSSSSQDGECPLVIDKETKVKQTCGNSRFGCWTCTVVGEDKSLKGFIESGETWLTPLVEYRNYLLEIRDKNKHRSIFNKRGQLVKAEVMIEDNKFIIPKKFSRKRQEIPLERAVSEEEAYQKIISGDYDLDEEAIIVKNGSKYYRVNYSGFTMDTRKDLLERLFKAEKKIRVKIPNYEIIKKEEVLVIDQLWKEAGYLETSAVSLYNEAQSDNVQSNNDYLDLDLIKELCKQEGFDENTLCSIIYSANKYRHLKNRSANMKSIKSKLMTQKLWLREKNENN